MTGRQVSGERGEPMEVAKVLYESYLDANLVDPEEDVGSEKLRCQGYGKANISQTQGKEEEPKHQHPRRVPRVCRGSRRRENSFASPNTIIDEAYLVENIPVRHIIQASVQRL